MDHQRVFRDNFRTALERHQKQSGESLRQFSDRVFGNDEAKYKWLRKLRSEGSPLKREGTKNHLELVQLHEALNLKFPSLWDRPLEIGRDVIRRLRKLLMTEEGAQVEAAVEKILNRYEYRQEAGSLLSRLEDDYPILVTLGVQLAGSSEALLDAVAEMLPSVQPKD